MTDPRDLPSPAAGAGPPRSGGPWPWVVLAIALALLATFAWTVKTLRDVPGEMVRAGGRAVEKLEGIAAAFSQGTVTHRFVSHTTRLAGSTYLQVALLEQVEVFELEESTTTLWGALSLPPVEVRATAPVTFTYFLDLDEPWSLELRDRTIRVEAPRLRWNKPAVDVSRLRYEVLKGSLLRDEEEVRVTLEREITGRTAIRAVENIPLVRETARRQTEGFVRNWLVEHYPDSGSFEIEVVFAGERGGLGSPPLSGPELGLTARNGALAEEVSESRDDPPDADEAEDPDQIPQPQ